MAFPRYLPDYEHQRDIALLKKQIQDEINERMIAESELNLQNNIMNMLKNKMPEKKVEPTVISQNIPLFVSGIPIHIKLLFEYKYTNATNIPVYLYLKRTELLKNICTPAHIILTKYLISKCTEAAKKLFCFIIDNIDLYELVQWNKNEFKINSKEARFKTIKIGNLSKTYSFNSEYGKTFYTPSTVYVDQTHMNKFNDCDRYLIFCALMHIKQWYDFAENRQIDKMYNRNNNKIIDMLDSIYED